MKKLLIMLAFAGFSLATTAQTTTDEVPVKEHSVATNGFWNNWFVQGAFNWNAWYAGNMYEHGHNLKPSPFKRFRSQPGLAISVGKWFTPGMGIRLKWQGLWGKQIRAYTSEATDPARDPQSKVHSKFNRYWILNGQAMLNLSQMICGYNPERFFSVVPFLGGGIGRSTTFDYYAMDISMGVMGLFRINKTFAAHVEVGWNRLECDIDGGYGFAGNRGWDSHTNNVYAELGLTVGLGKKDWDRVPDVDALNALHRSEIDALNSQILDLTNDRDRLKKLLAEKPKEVIKTVDESTKEFVNHPIHVFFNLAKTNVANPKDLVNVEGLAKYAKTTNSKLLVKGYADSATGTPEINRRLSIARANTLKEELVKMGVPAENITTEDFGGVLYDTPIGNEKLSPLEYNRRASVQVLPTE